MTIVVVVTAVGLITAACIALFRLIVGPTMVDRVIAAQMLLMVLGGAVAVRISTNGSDDAIDILIYVALLSFTGTVVAARFVERRSR